MAEANTLTDTMNTMMGNGKITTKKDKEPFRKQTETLLEANGRTMNSLKESSINLREAISKLQWKTENSKPNAHQ